MKKGRGRHETAIMTDKLSKEQAIEKGTSDLDESEVQKEELEW